MKLFTLPAFDQYIEGGIPRGRLTMIGAPSLTRSYYQDMLLIMSMLQGQVRLPPLQTIYDTEGVSIWDEVKQPIKIEPFIPRLSRTMEDVPCVEREHPNSGIHRERIPIEGFTVWGEPTVNPKFLNSNKTKDVVIDGMPSSTTKNPVSKTKKRKRK